MPLRARIITNLQSLCCTLHMDAPRFSSYPEHLVNSVNNTDTTLRALFSNTDTTLRARLSKSRLLSLFNLYIYILITGLLNPVGICGAFRRFLLGCLWQTQSESVFNFVGFFVIFFRVGKSLARHSPAKWCLCA